MCSTGCDAMMSHPVSGRRLSSRPSSQQVQAGTSDASSLIHAARATFVLSWRPDEVDNRFLVLHIQQRSYHRVRC